MTWSRIVAEVIVALDLADAPSAVALLDTLPGGVPVKVGSVLFTAAGPGFVRTLVMAGHPVFLDLKWHDIPNTVAGAVRSAADLGVEMATIHALGGEAMIAAAVAAAAGRLKLVAVTVLTSHDPLSWGASVGRETPELGGEVERLAMLAMAGGADGIVCSATELPNRGRREAGGTGDPSLRRHPRRSAADGHPWRGCCRGGHASGGRAAGAGGGRSSGGVPGVLRAAVAPPRGRALGPGPTAPGSRPIFMPHPRLRAQPGSGIIPSYSKTPQFLGD
jgi:orotidine-5'-phosphate decarboxylase